MTFIVAQQNPNLEGKIADSISSVVRRSFKNANRKSNAYTKEQETALLESYSSHNIRQNFEPLICAFAYNERLIGDGLVGTGFLNSGCYEYYNGIWTENQDVANGFLYGLYVRPRMQGRGIGMEMLLAIINIAKQHGIRRIQGFSTIFPRVAERYEQHGFELGVTDVLLNCAGTLVNFREINLYL